MTTKRKLHPLIMFGLGFLVIGSIVLRIHPSAMGGEDVHDSISGLLYGLAIGCMLFGILKSRKPSGSDEGQAPE